MLTHRPETSLVATIQTAAFPGEACEGNLRRRLSLMARGRIRGHPPVALAACLALLALLGFLLAVPVAAQVVTVGTGTLNNGPTTYPAPYGNWYWGSRHQFLIPASELAAAGLPAGPPGIGAIAFEVAAVGGAPLENLQILIGHTSATTLTSWVPGLFLVYAAPSYTESVGWSTHSLVFPFIWDGVSNLVVETCHNNASFTTNAIFNQTATPGYDSSLWYRADAAGVCMSSAITGSVAQRPNLRFTMATPPAQFQVNQPESSLDIDGVQGTASTPAITTRCTGSTATANLSSNITSPLWEMAGTLGPLVSVDDGAKVFPGLQVLNIDLTNPTLFFLNGGALPVLGPYPGNVSVPVAVSSMPGILAVQQLVVDNSQPGSFSLSQGAQLDAVAGVSVPGPVGDNSSILVNLGGLPLCGPGALPFYATSYTQMYVISNGRVVFGTADDDFTPTPGEALLGSPFAGYWTDLDPSLGGAITVTATGGNLVQVDYTAVPYGAEPGAVLTFGIEFDALAGVVQITGLTGVPPNPVSGGMAEAADSAFLGISSGLAGGATDGGPTLFTAGGSGAPAVATDMIYDFLDATTASAPFIVPSLSPGTLSTLVLTPSGNNYTWSGL